MHASDDFFNLVVTVRELQKEYFKNRNSYTLKECKKQEKRLDNIITSLLDERTKPVDLFSDIIL